MFIINIISSLSVHRIELQTYQESLDFKFDILAITEVDRYNVKNNAAFFKDYKLIHDETKTNKGGTALLVSKKTYDVYLEPPMVRYHC